MNMNIKRTSFIILGLVIITVIFALSKFNIANAAKEDGKKFGDWVVSCTPKNEKAKTPEVCVLSQRINLTKDDKQQQIALLQLGYFGEKKDLKMIQTLPLGVNLETGTSIISSKNLISPGKYTFCTQAGCQAIASITSAELKNIHSTKENAIAFMSIDGQQITLPMSAKGLTRGLKYIK